MFKYKLVILSYLSFIYTEILSDRVTFLMFGFPIANEYCYFNYTALEFSNFFHLFLLRCRKFGRYTVAYN